jgi:hypothetical protein
MGRLARRRTPGRTWMHTLARSSHTMVSRRCSTTLSFSAYRAHLVWLPNLSGIAHLALVSVFGVHGNNALTNTAQLSNVPNHIQRRPLTNFSRIKTRPLATVAERSLWGGPYGTYSSRERYESVGVREQTGRRPGNRLLDSSGDDPFNRRLIFTAMQHDLLPPLDSFRQVELTRGFRRI